MIIKVIDWEHKTIKEIETKTIRYLEDGLHYDIESGNIIYDRIVPYNELLGVSGL